MHLFQIYSFTISVILIRSYNALNGTDKLRLLIGINISSLNKCKLTILGYEYAGNLAKTSSGYRCQYWNLKNPIHKVSEQIEDENFIDGSKKLAKNYCRNPNNNPKGPWCYTTNPEIKIDFCNVPICLIPDCRVSSLGSEYGGILSKSISGLKCEVWKVGPPSVNSEFTFPETNFPSGNLGPEKRSCRNPNGNPAGPWCWVKPTHDTVINEEGFIEDEENVLDAELCDVPFCNEPGCLSFSNGGKLHQHYISLPESSQNLTIWLKPWLMKDWVPQKGGKFARLFLSTTPSPFGSGFELKLPLFGGDSMELRYLNYGEDREGAHLAMGAEEDEDENYLIRKLTNWSVYRIIWSKEVISVNALYNYEGDKEITQLVSDPSDSKFQKEQEEDLMNIKYISSSGEPSLWSIECDESRCPVHTIHDSEMHHWERLHSTQTGTYLQFNGRAFGVIGIELASTPLDIGPRIKIIIGEKNYTVASIGEKSTGQKDYKYSVIQSGDVEIALTYWEWKEFSISLFEDRIQIYSIPKRGPTGQTQTILETRHSAVYLMKWYSAFSPKKTVTHWTFFCSPEENDEIPAALPPECVTSVGGRASRNYIGNQWVTHSGLPCLPWVSPRVSQKLSMYNHQFPDASVRHAKNLCRNPTGGPLGPWCFRLGKIDESMGSNEMNELVAEECGVRLCRYADCRMSGLGTDYIGTLNRTISGRECQRWDASIPHQVPQALLNSSLYADQNVTMAGSFCRNPSKNNAGPWCFTLDPNAITDVCDVRDCVRPEACTVLVRGVGTGRLLYVLPQWKTQDLTFWLKEWDPDLTDGLVFILRPSEGERYYKLVIGADENQKVKMFYKNDSGEILVKEKTVHYVIPAGRWGGFWLKLGHGWLRLGYEGVHNQHLFEWTHRNSDLHSPDSPFTPNYLTFTSYLGNTIGMFFPCGECHVERTSTHRFTKLIPIRREVNSTRENFVRLSFHLRGDGIALIPLMRQPGRGEYHAVTIGEKGGKGAYIVFQEEKKEKSTVLMYALADENLLRTNEWTRFTIEFNESLIRVIREDIIIMDYVTTVPLLFYWFSVGSEKGQIIWAANCDPPDIDGPPINGGWGAWSPWQCSVTCGGGAGRRTRQCNNPAPNVFGSGCEGPQLSEGPCNQFPCGSVSPDLVESIRDSLRTSHANFVAEEGESIMLPCGNFSGNEDLLNEAMREAPDSSVGWTKDGAHLLNRTSLSLVDNFDVILHNVESDDSGVYVCILWKRAQSQTRSVTKGGLTSFKKNERKESAAASEMQTPLPISVVSLVVVRPKTSAPTLSVRETTTASLPCNAIPLGLIYADLRIQWNLNGEVWKDYGFVSLDAISEETFEAKKQHEGEWLCVVTQPDLEFTWFTNWILLEVKPPPNFFNMLMEDKLTAPIFGRLGSETIVTIVFISSIVLFVLVVIVSTIIAIRYLNKQKVELIK